MTNAKIDHIIWNHKDQQSTHLLKDDQEVKINNQGGQEKVFYQLIRELKNKTKNQKLPTLRRTIMVMGLPFQYQNQENFKSKYSQQEYQKDPLNSSKFAHQKSDIKLGKTSKLFALRKKQFKKIQVLSKDKKQNQMKKAIFQMVGQIHNVNNSKVFYSQPHFRKQQNSGQKYFKTTKTSKMQGESNPLIVQFSGMISNPSSFRILENDRDCGVTINRKKSSSQKGNEQMNKMKVKQAYFYTIKELDLRRKVQINRKNPYHKIEANKTQEWFFMAQKSRTKLSKLIEQKRSKLIEQKRSKLIEQKRSKQQTKRQKQGPQKSNSFVSKLISESRKSNQMTKQQFGQIMGERDKSRTLVLSNREVVNSSDYRGKGKKYYHAEGTGNGKRVNSINMGHSSKAQVEILPQIKAYRKFQF